MSQTTSKRSCPCKTLPWSLSSLTAAEFGDVHALSKRKRPLGPSSDKTSSPLQMAAQHGHVAATAWLLQQPEHNSTESCVTPLHRASFSGSVATIRLLLDHQQRFQRDDFMCQLLLGPDKSFGDDMTALHKAASGGRYLAVQLLLTYLESSNLMKRGLAAKDAQGRTARDVAVEKRSISDQEAKSVARWNEVSGGLPDWDRCVQLLRSAAFQLGSSAHNAPDTKSASGSTILSPHLRLGDVHCGDCTADGLCVTAAWERDFRNSLQGMVDRNLLESKEEQNIFELGSNQKTGLRRDDIIGSFINNTPEAKESGRVGVEDGSGKKSDNIGSICSKCRNSSLVLYRRGDSLVCRKCRRTAHSKKEKQHSSLPCTRP